jgi:hypothetical protein
MSYFFNDKANKKSAEVGFMRKIICALNCQFYEPSSLIIEKDKPVDAVHFIFDGWA